MPTRVRAVQRGTARGRAIVQGLCRELADAMADRGLSYAAVGRPLGLSGQQVGRICRGTSPNVSVVRMAQLFAIVGLELSARGFPGGQPFRDAGHAALLERLRVRLGTNLKFRTEVPVVPATDVGPRDQRAWDAVIEGAAWTVGVEAETRVRDLQALERRLALKARDGSVAVVLLLLSDTRHHRELVAARPPSLTAAFPGGARAMLGALGRGDPPPSNGVVLL